MSEKTRQKYIYFLVILKVNCHKYSHSLPLTFISSHLSFNPATKIKAVRGIVVSYGDWKRKLILHRY